MRSTSRLKSWGFASLRPTAIERCRALGYGHYNGALGESQSLVHPQWQNADGIARWLVALPDCANSGDIYARFAGAEDTEN